MVITMFMFQHDLLRLNTHTFCVLFHVTFHFVSQSLNTEASKLGAGPLQRLLFFNKA